MKVQKIREGFKSITEQHSVVDAGKAYADFHALIEKEQESFTPETVVKLGEHNDVYLDRLRRARAAMTRVYPPRVSIDGEHYFAGTGVVVLGSSDGEILAVDTGYTPEHDEVARMYGDKYVRVAVRKAGQAAYLLAVRNMSESQLDPQATIEQVLVEQGLKSATDPAHHHGYAVGEFHHSVGATLVAGASGMLPSTSVHRTLARELSKEYQDGIDAGLFDWENDFLAGYHDEVAAEQAVKLAFAVPRIGGIAVHVNTARERLANGHNLH